ESAPSGGQRDESGRKALPGGSGDDNSEFKLTAVDQGRPLAKQRGRARLGRDGHWNRARGASRKESVAGKVCDQIVFSSGQSAHAKVAGGGRAGAARKRSAGYSHAGCQRSALRDQRDGSSRSLGRRIAGEFLYVHREGHTLSVIDGNAVAGRA